MNTIQPILEHLIGVYTPNSSALSGLGSLDYGYFVRAVFLLLSFAESISFLKLCIVRFFSNKR